MVAELLEPEARARPQVEINVFAVKSEQLLDRAEFRIVIDEGIKPRLCCAAEVTVDGPSGETEDPLDLSANFIRRSW
jgi:hypothetical protein